MPLKSNGKTKAVELDKKLREIKVQEQEEESKSSASEFNLPFSDLKKAPVDPEALNIISEDTARISKLAILYKSGTKLAVALLNPNDPDTQKTLESLKKMRFELELMITTSEALERVWNRYKLTARPSVFRVGAIEIDEKELFQLQSQIKDLNDIKNKLLGISITKLLETLIAGALKTRTSDIHFEADLANTRLRYRIDGILNDVALIEKTYYEKLLNRVKILSKLKLNLRNSPQEGRFTIKQQSVDIEVRISLLPSEFGETLVMKLLDPRNIHQKLEDLGFRPDFLELIKKQVKKSTGAMIMTGPTGAGKTTTLYALANSINSPGIKIITIEDPIEYHVQGISQTQVNPTKNYTFVTGLKSIVRQNPDVILVGEVRDKETAEIALNAALTGHLVLTTLHANNAAGAIPRLLDLGIKDQIIAPAINMIMAQRLLRKLCPHCKISKKPTEPVLTKIKSILSPIKTRFDIPTIDSSLKIYSPGTCDKCQNSGYIDRTGVSEGFVMSKSLEALALKTPAMSEVESLAITEGMVTMIQDAYLKIISGITSVEEADRFFS